MKIEHYMTIALVLIIIFTFPIFPIPQQVNADDVIIIKTSGTPSCAGANSFVLAQNLTDLCDVTIISPSTNQILKYNGTQWVNSAVSFGDTTACNNLGAGVIICRDGNVNMRTLASGTGVSITNSSTTITVTNTLPENTVCNNASGGGEGFCINNLVTLKRLLAGSNLSLSSNSTHITVTNTAPESTVCNNQGSIGLILCTGGNLNIKKIVDESGSDCVEVLSNATRLLVRDGCIKDAVNALGNGVSIIQSVIPPDLTLRKILGINGISVTQNGTVLVDGSALQNQETTTCTNAGGTTWIKTSSGGNCVLKGVTAGNMVTITSNTNDNQIGVTEPAQVVVTTFQTRTFVNVGVSYVDVYSSAFDNEEYAGNILSCGNFTQFSAIASLDYIGTGTNGIRIVDASDNANVLLERNDITTDLNGAFINFNSPNHANWVNKPAWCTGNKIIEIQMKSTVSTDDPSFKGYTLWGR